MLQLGDGGAGVLPQGAARHHDWADQAGDGRLPEESAHGVCKSHTNIIIYSTSIYTHWLLGTHECKSYMHHVVTVHPRLSGFETRPKRDRVLTKVGVSQL